MTLLVAGRTDSAVSIVNLNALIKGLKKMGLKTQDLSGATTRVRNLVVPPAISRAPVRTGKLRSTVKARKYPNKVEVQAGNNTTVLYANPIHWGWQKRNIKPNTWLLDIRDEKVDEVEDIFVEELQKLINKVQKEIR